MPSWSNGVNIGDLIAGYHNKFVDALIKSAAAIVVPEPPLITGGTVDIALTTSPGVTVSITLEWGTDTSVEAGLNDIMQMPASIPELAGRQGRGTTLADFTPLPRNAAPYLCELYNR